MKISVRQICFIMLIYTVVTRLLLYPTTLSYFTDRDLLFSALIDFVPSAIVIWAVSFLCSRTDKSFFELLENTFGNIIARIIYGTFALFFLAATLFPIFEQKLYVHAIFYDTVPALTVFLPFFFFAIYAGSKGFTNIGRCADISLPIFIVSMFLIFAMSFTEVDFGNLLPILKSPAKNVFGAAAGTLFRFAEPCYLLMFMGHFKYKKGDAARITLSYIGGALIVLLFLAVFYGVYGNVAPSRQFAVSKIALFFPAIETIGRVDLIALYILEAVMLFALVLNIQLAVHCLVKCTGLENKMVFSLAVNIVLAVLLIVLDHYFNSISIFYNKWMWIAFIIFPIVMPLLAWTLKRRDKVEKS